MSSEFLELLSIKCKNLICYYQIQLLQFLALLLSEFPFLILELNKDSNITLFFLNNFICYNFS